MLKIIRHHCKNQLAHYRSIKASQNNKIQKKEVIQSDSTIFLYERYDTNYKQKLDSILSGDKKVVEFLKALYNVKGNAPYKIRVRLV